jgi:hypothetical protein
LAPASPARTLLPKPMHRPERRSRQRRERARMVSDRGRDALAAGQAAHQQMPRVAFVLGAARRAHRRPPVPTPHIRDPVKFAARGVPRPDLARAAVDQAGGPDQPHRTGTTAGAFLGVAPAGLTDQYGVESWGVHASLLHGACRWGPRSPPTGMQSGKAPLFRGVPAAGDHRGITGQHKLEVVTRLGHPYRHWRRGPEDCSTSKGALRRGFRSPDPKR